MFHHHHRLSPPPLSAFLQQRYPCLEQHRSSLPRSLARYTKSPTALVSAPKKGAKAQGGSHHHRRPPAVAHFPQIARQAAARTTTTTTAKGKKRTKARPLLTRSPPSLPSSPHLSHPLPAPGPRHHRPTRTHATTRLAAFRRLHSSPANPTILPNELGTVALFSPLMPSASLRGIGRPFKAPAGLASAAATSPTDPSQTTPDGGPSGAAATTATATADDSTAADADLPTPSDTDPSPTNGDSLPPVSSSSSLPATTTNGLIVPTTTNANSLSPSSSAASVSEKPSKFGILSRLNIQLPGRRSNRHIVDFHILPDEPHKQYVSGDSVRGSVVLAIVKPVRITHLVVTLHGYVHVYKDPSVVRSQTATITPRGGSSTLPQYHGNGVASLFQDEQVLSGDGRLEAGRYEFGFDLLFPDKSLPSSIEVCRAHPTYLRDVSPVFSFICANLFCSLNEAPLHT